MEAMIEITENHKVKRKNIRPEVAMFALEMERVLEENDHKTGWCDLSIHVLYTRIKQEFEELQEQYITMNHHLGDNEQFIQKMRDEAIDIANFCMFLCHNYPKEVPEELRYKKEPSELLSPYDEQQLRYQRNDPNEI